MKQLFKFILLSCISLLSINVYAEEIPNDEIWYTSSEGSVVQPYKFDVFGATIISNTYSDGKGVIKFDGNVTSIGSDAFEYRSSLTSITIPNSVTSIGSYAFYDCYGLTSITIPNSVESIGNYAFYGCSGFTSIIVESGNTKYDSRNNCNAIIETATNTLIAGCKNTEIPNSVTSIGGYAFSYCTGLTSITIPNSVKNIGDYAFSGCSGLTSITIPNSVTSIGEEAFYGCSGLTSITIPNSVTSIGNRAFQACTGLTCIIVESGNTKYDSRNNCNAIIETATNTLIAGCNNTVIPNSVTNIGNSAFYDCSGLTSITIPNSVTSIGDWAFSDCTGLTSITIPNSVTSIGEYAFYDCTGLTSITIPNSVKSIGYDAFRGCYFQKDKFINNSKCPSSYNLGAKLCDERTTDGLCLLNNEVIKCVGKSASVVIPNYVTSIGSSAFYRCTGLTSITIPNSVTSIGSSAFEYCSSLTSVTIPNSVTSIGNYAFYQCSSLTSITIPNSVESIGNYAFYGCSSLTSIAIPNSVTSIGSYAFDGCSRLTSITIPNSVTSIGGQAFYGCSGFTSIYVSWKEPLYLSTSLFSYGIDYSKCVLYVPVGTSSLYASADVWKNFQHIVEFEPKYNMFAADNNGNDINKVINSGDDVTIDDTYQSLSVTEDIDNVNVSYSRTYKNTSWQAWYVPFGFTLTSDIASRFSFAKFAGTYTEAGQFFITLVEMQEGDEIKGNVPYFVQAKVADSSNPQVLNISNTTLYATDASGFKMLSAEKEIAIYGTYAKKVAAADDDWYAYGGGKYIKATTGQSLGAFRFYLTIRDREDNPYASTPNPIEIKVVVLGDEADGISGLNDDDNDNENVTMFNLAGQPVGADYKGIVIRNGKKTFIH